MIPPAPFCSRYWFPLLLLLMLSFCRRRSCLWRCVFLFFSLCLCCVAACFVSFFWFGCAWGVFFPFISQLLKRVCVSPTGALQHAYSPPSGRLSVRLLLCLSVRLPFLVGKGSVCTCLRASCVWPVHMRTCACVLIPFWMQAPLSARVITEFAPPSPRNLPAQNGRSTSQPGWSSTPTRRTTGGSTQCASKNG